MRLIISVFILVFAVAVLAPVKPAHALLTTGNQVYDGSGTTNDIANWVFGDGQGDDLSTAEADNAFEVFLITGETVHELARVEAPSTSTDGLSVTGTLFNGDGEILAGEWWYDGPEIVGYIALKAAGVWGLFDYTSSISDPNHGYFDVACLNALTAVDTACNDLTQAQLEAIFGTGDNNRPHAMSHVTAYTPLPGAVWLFLSALAGLFGVGYTRRNRAA